MAAKTINIPDLTATAEVQAFYIERRGGAWTCVVTYTNGGNTYQTTTPIKATDLTAPDQATMAAGLAVLRALAKPLMKRSDGGDDTGF